MPGRRGELARTSHSCRWGRPSHTHSHQQWSWLKVDYYLTLYNLLLKVNKIFLLWSIMLSLRTSAAWHPSEKKGRFLYNWQLKKISWENIHQTWRINFWKVNNIWRIMALIHLDCYYPQKIAPENARGNLVKKLHSRLITNTLAQIIHPFSTQRLADSILGCACKLKSSPLSLTNSNLSLIKWLPLTM